MRFLNIFGGTFAAKVARETRIVDLLREKSILVIANLELLEQLEAVKIETHNALEQAAAARLRNVDLNRRLQVTLEALDKARMENGALKEAEADRRIADLNNEKEGPKRDLEKFNDAQAARAMSRNTKAHFVAYQHAVKMILDRIDELGQKNHVTKEDLRKLRQLREDLSAQINRTI